MAAPAVEGAGTRIWNFQDIETWLEGEFEGTGLTSRGEIIPTVTMRNVDLPNRLAWDSVSTDTYDWVATALPGGIQRIDPDGETKSVLELEQLGVTAIFQQKGVIYAGTSSEGDIYRRTEETGEFAKISEVSDSYIWDFAPAPDQDGLYIATGPSGSLYHMTGGGGIEKIDETPGHNVMDLTIHRDTLYLGDDLGGLYQLKTDDSGNHSIESIYGFPQGEIGALTSDGRHLYMAINIRKSDQSKQKREQQISQLAKQLRQQSIDNQAQNRDRPSPYVVQDQASTDPSILNPGDELSNRPPTRAPVPSRRPDPETKERRQTMIEKIRENAQRGRSELFAGLAGTLVYRLNPPSRMNIVYNDPEEIVHDLEAHTGNLYIATGGKGRLYRVEEDFTRTAYFQTDQKNLLSLQLKNGQPSAVTTGEGGSFYWRDDNGEIPTYRSAPIDAQLLSRWGTMKSISEGTVRFRTRSGNSKEPGPNWNDWSTVHDGTPFSIESQPARFLQFEVQFPERTGQLENVQIAYRIPNQKPQIGALQVAPNPNRMPIHSPTLATQTGEKSSNNQSSEHQKPSSASSMKMPVRQIKWRVLDPDGDQIETSLSYRIRDREQWLELSELQVRKNNQYNWKTTNYSDGWYLIRLTASDQSQNPPGEEYRTHKQVGPILVDNTSPEFQTLTRKNGQIHFTATDETSWVIRAEYRVNGKEWKPLAPLDGIFDQKTEKFKLNTKKLGADGELIELRIVDEGGNRSLRRVPTDNP